MRYLLALILSAIMLAGCERSGSPGYRIDEQATAQAQWKPGEVVANGEVDWGNDIGKHNFYRKFIGITDKGYAVVQDFYDESDNKFSDPFAVIQPDRIGDIGLVMEDMDIFGSTLLDGELTLWYENGQKESERHFKDEAEQGHWTLWYANGQKSEERHYQDGKLQGLWTYWYENGQKWFEVNYQDGKKQGLWTRWYGNGQKLEEGNYQDGKKQGLWTYWDEDGKKISETLYEADEVVRETNF